MRYRSSPVSAAAALLLLLLFIATAAALPFASVAAHSFSKKQKSSSSPRPVKTTTYQAQSRRSSFASAVFPLYGDVYPLGFYYATVTIGEPPKPYFLDVDSGSDLTWLQCDAPCVRCAKGPHPWYRPLRSKLVACKDPLCLSLRSSTSQPNGNDGCIDSPLQCDYQIDYADGGSSLGVLVADTFAMRLTNGSIAHPTLSFGCGYDQLGTETTSLTDGVLGLAHGATGMLAQLSSQGITRSVVGQCLSRHGGGYLFFGDDLVPIIGVTWTPMSSTHNKYYSPGAASLYYGKDLLVKEMQLVFDSGSSYTYFGIAPYQALIMKMKKDLSGKSLKEASEDQTLPICWKGAKPFKALADVRKYFKTLVVSFLNGKKQKAQLDVPPENYLIVSKQGNACLGILNGTEAGIKDNVNIIGDISMQDLMVVYDNEQQQIGWVHTSCDRLPNADETAGDKSTFYWPKVSDLGILTQQCPSSYDQ